MALKVTLFACLLASLFVSIYMYEDFELDGLSTEEIYQQNLACYLADTDEACTDRQKEFKKELIEKCANCTDIRKEKLRELMAYIKEHKKEAYDKVIAKYPFTADLLKV